MLSYIPYMFVMALVTYLIRMLPLTFFQKELKSTFTRSFLFYVPYAVLGAMSFPSIFTASGTSGTQVIASTFGACVAMYLSYRGKSLLTVAIAACAVVYVVNLIL